MKWGWLNAERVAEREPLMRPNSTTERLGGWGYLTAWCDMVCCSTSGSTSSSTSNTGGTSGTSTSTSVSEW